MSGLQCEKCGQTLALADERCAACGTLVPLPQRLGILLPRAEGLAEQERWADAARALDPVLALALDPAQAKGLWRKKGVWLRKAAQTQPQHLDGAEAALGEALRLDDSDDLSHQVWIDLLVQRGYAEKARTWYAQRLQLNPDDAMAKRQMAVLKLASDFKAQPKPQSQIAEPEPQFLLWRLIVPNAGKTWTMGLSGLFTLIMFFHSVLSPAAAAAPSAAAPVDPDLASAVSASMSGMPDIFNAMDSPSSWAIQTLVSIAYVYWAYSRRKGAKRG